MSRRTAAARLACEPLEARDVPAIVIDALVNDDNTDYAPTGGFVTVNELAIDESIQVVFRDGTPVDPAVRTADAADIVTLTRSGSGLVITSTDGIYGRTTNLNNALVFYGNTLTVPNVTGLAVSLQLGGDDSLTETTPFATTVDAGPGNDLVRVTGSTLSPAVLQLLQTPGTLQRLVMSGISIGPAKTIRGGSGNDTLIATGAMSNLTINGGDGNDVINGPSFGYLNVLNGDAGNDTIRAAQFGGFNLLDGGADRDIVFGGPGVDFLIGGTGIDILIGQGGGDTYLAADVDLDFVFNLSTDTVSADTFDTLAFRLPAPVPPFRTRT